MKYSLPIWLTLLVCLFSGIVFGQEIPVPPSPESFASPGTLYSSQGKGLLIGYGFNGRTNLGILNGTGVDGADQRLTNFDRLRAKIKIPIIIKDRTKLLIGTKHLRESYHFKTLDIENPDIVVRDFEDAMKSTNYGIYLLQSFNNRNYIAAKLGLSYNGNYNGWVSLDSDYAIYRLSFLYGIKKSEMKEWGFGFVASHNSRRTIALPYIVYNQTFNSRWGVETVIPASLKARYNTTKSSYFIFGSEFESREYFIFSESTKDVPDYLSLNRQEIRFVVDYEFKLGGWIWMGFRAGYQNVFNIRFFDQEVNEVNDFQQSSMPNGFMGSINFFISPSSYDKEEEKLLDED